MADKRPAEGSVEDAQAKMREAEEPESVLPEPFKIVGTLVGVTKDEDGEIVGEEVMGEVVVYRSQFGKLEELVQEALERAKEA